MKSFKLNQKVLWHTEDFDGTVDQSAVITEVHEDHCIEQELYLIKDTNDVLYAMLERIAWQNPDYYQWALNRE